MSVPFSMGVVATPDTLINVIGEESVLLNLTSERYFGLDDIGTHMWQVLISSASIQIAYDTLLAEYDIEADVLKRDLASFIAELSSRGLVDIRAV